MRGWQAGLAGVAALTLVSGAGIDTPTSVLWQSLSCQPGVLTLLGEPEYSSQRPVVNHDTLLLTAKGNNMVRLLELQRLQPVRMTCGPAGKALILGLALNSFAELLQVDVSSGEIEWATPLLTRTRGKSKVDPVDLQRAPDGSIWVVHNVQGPIAGTTGDGADLLLQQVSAAGELLGTRRLGTDQDDVAAALALTGPADQTRVWVGGATTSAINFPQVARAPAGGWNALVLEVTATTATPLVFGTSGDDHVTALEASADQLYLAGYSDGAWSGARHDPVNADGFVASLGLDQTRSINVNARLAFAQAPRAFGSPLHADHFRTLAVLPGGEVVAAGDTDGTLGHQTSSGQKDVMLVKYSPALKVLESRQLGTAGNDSAYDLNVLGADRILLSGLSTGGAATGQKWWIDSALKVIDP